MSEDQPGRISALDRIAADFLGSPFEPEPPEGPPEFREVMRRIVGTVAVFSLLVLILNLLVRWVIQ